MPVRLVITGAPASGKTTFLHRLKVEPRFADWLFFDELARNLLQHSPELRQQPDRLHREIYRQQVARETAAGERSFISDRGTLDAMAFHQRTMTDVDTSAEREYRRYSAIIQLGSTASLGERYYRTDTVRTEPPEVALNIEQALREVWSGHPQYYFVPAAHEWEEKSSRFLALVNRIIVPAERIDDSTVPTSIKEEL